MVVIKSVTVTLLIIQNQWRANIDSNFYNNKHWFLEQMDPVEPKAERVID